jgi:hypothetical protein
VKNEVAFKKYQIFEKNYYEWIKKIFNLNI